MTPAEVEDGQEKGYNREEDSLLMYTKKAETLEPFSSHVIPVKTMKVHLAEHINVMMQALHAQDGTLLPGLTMQNMYTKLRKGGKKAVVVVQNHTAYPQTLQKKTPVARAVSALPVPEPPKSQSLQVKNDTYPDLHVSKLMVRQRHGKLFNELDLSDLNSWTPEVADMAHQLLAEYHDMFSLDLAELGCTHSTEHTIKVTDDTPFKEQFRQIPPPMVEEVRNHLKKMLESSVIRPSQSTWCNAVVLVRKKDSSLCFCIDFRHLNAHTKKDSYPLPRIQEVSKQYTAFTLGKLGFIECDAPATFQWLMQNCMGELNFIYCLIYLDDLIMILQMAEEHLHRLHVVFDCLREYNLKLKPSKCSLFQEKINYLAHQLSKKGVWPSDINVKAIIECAPPQTYTEIRAFLGLVCHYRWFIKGFARIAQPLNEHLAGKGTSRKLEQVSLSKEALGAFVALKQAHMKSPMLAFVNYTKDFYLKKMPPRRDWEQFFPKNRETNGFTQ